MQQLAPLAVCVNGTHSPSETTHAVEQPQLSQRNGASSPPRAVRNHLPDERPSVTHKFDVGSHEGYITVGLYPDGQPGELFIVMAKEGSTVSGLINSFAQAVSIGLQHGVPLKLFCDKFSYTRFEPCGWTGNPAIRQATSVMDYIFRWLEQRFLAKEPAIPATASQESPLPLLPQVAEATDARACRICGSLMVRNGACHSCAVCGWTSGCS